MSFLCSSIDFFSLSAHFCDSNIQFDTGKFKFQTMKIPIMISYEHFKLLYVDLQLFLFCIDGWCAALGARQPNPQVVRLGLDFNPMTQQERLVFEEIYWRDLDNTLPRWPSMGW